MVPANVLSETAVRKTEGYLSEVFVSFQGEGAHVGRRHLFVRFAGCNIRCRYCDTPGSLERTPSCTIWYPNRRQERANPISSAELGALIRDFVERDAPIDAIAFTGGEPLVQADFLATMLATERVGLPVLLETNGVLPNKLAEVLPFIDIISMDVKLPSNARERPFWDEHAAFLGLAGGKDLYIKVLVDETTDPAEVDRAFKMVADQQRQAAVFLQPISGPTGGVEVGAGKLAEFYKIGRNHLESVRVLPQTHKMIGVM